MPAKRSPHVRNEARTGSDARIRPAIYKAPLPDLPARTSRRRRIADRAEIEAMLTQQEREQRPLVEAGGRIQTLVGERNDESFANLALEHNPPALVLFWKGPFPEAMQQLVDELRSTVRIDVRQAAYSRSELLDEAHRIIALDTTRIGIKIWSVGPLNDSSGLKVVIDQTDDIARAKREIHSPIKLEFDVGGPIVPA